MKPARFLVVLATTLCASPSLFAQNYPEVAPRPVPAAPAPAPEVAPTLPAASNDERIVLPALKGLVFVGSVDRVKRAGIAQTATDVDPSDLALLKGEDFLAAMRAYIGKPLTF